MSVILIAYNFTRYITKPITNLERIALKVAQGDLNVSIDDGLKSKNDEVGHLAKSFDAMISNLKDLLKNMINNIDVTKQSAEDLALFSNEVKSSTQKVADTMSTIAEGGKALSTSANNSVTATDTLISSIQAVATSAQTSASKSKKLMKRRAKAA